MFSQHFLHEVSSWHLLKHPFYKAWIDGRLTLKQLQNYALQYSPHVDAFPRYVSLVHSQCENLLIRRELAQNLADEEGITGGLSHPTLWRHFAYALGLSAEDFNQVQIALAAEKLAKNYFQLCQTSYVQGLAALTSYEYQVPEISKSKIEGLKKFNITSEGALKFFRVHESADVYHSQACLAAMDLLTSSEQKLALQAGREASGLLWNFLSEVYAAA